MYDQLREFLPKMGTIKVDYVIKFMHCFSRFMTYQGLITIGYRDSIQLYYIVLFIKVDYYVSSRWSGRSC